MTTGRPRGQLTRWTDHLGQHLPHLSKPQRTVLALWTYAATLTEHVGSTTCAAFLPETLGESENTLRQRLREFYRPAAVKRGPDRRDLDVRLAFGPLPAWALALLRPPELVLALDPTLCRDRLAVLTVAVVAHGCAIPVAWVAVRANEPGAWMPHWLPMLAALAAVVPRRTRVVVVADRGLQSTALFAEIVALGWHPMIRLTRVGMWRERGAPRWTALAALPLRPGEHYVMRGHVFATRPHACTLVAVWRLGFDAPWLLMTDLPPQRCERAFYGLRCWRRGCAARTGLPVPEVGWAAMRAAADHGAGAGRAGVAGAIGVALVDARGRCGTGAGGDGRRRRPPDAECAPPGVDPASGRRASRSTASTAAPSVCSVAPNPDAGRDGETAVVNTYPCQARRGEASAVEGSRRDEPDLGGFGCAHSATLRAGCRDSSTSSG